MKRFCTTLAAFALLAAIVAVPATAKPAQYANTLSAIWSPYEDPLTGAFKGSVSSRSQHLCEKGRRVDVFRGSTKVGSAKTDSYGAWYLVFNSPIEPGNYVAKVAKTKVGDGFCKAASSKPMTVG
jgi:hypothetical protein